LENEFILLRWIAVRDEKQILDDNPTFRRTRLFLVAVIEEI
jgi:hypothetical protein